MVYQPEFLLPQTSTQPDVKAVWSPNVSLTWKELENRAYQFACALRNAGLVEGDAWAILAPNRAEWVEASLGNARAGTRYVPLNWHSSRQELTSMLIDSNALLLIVDPAYLEIGAAAATAANVKVVVTLGAQYEQWLASTPPLQLEDGPLGYPLQFTGGTTGPSRGVVRPEALGKSASDFAQVSNRWAMLTGMPSSGRSLLVTPAYHSLGGAMIRSSIAHGLSISILPKWDEQSVLAAIDEQQIVATAMVPTQFIRILKLPEEVRNTYDLSSLKWLLHTAAPVAPWAKHAMINWFGPVLVELYGSSEGGGPFVCTSEEWLQRPGTVGRPKGGLEVFILDSDGLELPAGETGQVYVRRPDGVPIYHGDEAKSAEMRLPDGRFTVGDLGWLDEDGYLFIADRRVDLIISGGSNIYPAEIEAVLNECPGVADVAVFGVPNPEWGQEIVAVVEPVDGSVVDELSIRAHAQANLAGFKVPRTIVFIDQMPREASGKLKKHRLRDQYLEKTL